MFKSQSIFAEFLVVILTFHKKINILRLLALKHSERSAGDAQGHGGKKIEKKKEKNLQAVSRISSASLASLIWLKGNRNGCYAWAG